MPRLRSLSAISGVISLHESTLGQVPKNRDESEMDGVAVEKAKACLSSMVTNSDIMDWTMPH